MIASLKSDFMRVTKRTPCPVCGKPDWCLVSRDDLQSPSLAICARTRSPCRWGDAGYLHRLNDRPSDRRRIRRLFSISVRSETPNTFDAVAAAATERISTMELTILSTRLGVTGASLVRLGVGWMDRDTLADVGTKTRASGVFSFPMCDADGRGCGVRLRDLDGGKFCILGSQNGLFVPTDMTAPLMRLFIAEGESDTAALLDVGFDAIGKPGAGGADALVSRFVRRTHPRQVVVVADNDAIGRDRAHRLARRLALDHRDVRVVAPPEGIKDARDWKRRGANRDDIELLIAATHSITVKVVAKTGRLGHGT